MIHSEATVPSRTCCVLSCLCFLFVYLFVFPYAVISCRMPFSILPLFPSKGPVELLHSPRRRPRIQPHAPVASALLTETSCTAVQREGYPSLIVSTGVFAGLRGRVPFLNLAVVCSSPASGTPMFQRLCSCIIVLHLCWNNGGLRGLRTHALPRALLSLMCVCCLIALCWMFNLSTHFFFFFWSVDGGTNKYFI